MSDRFGSEAPVHDGGNVRRDQLYSLTSTGTPPVRRQADPEAGLDGAVVSDDDRGLRQDLLAGSGDSDDAALAASPPDHGSVRGLTEPLGEHTGDAQPPRTGAEHIDLEGGCLLGKDYPHPTRRGEGVTLDVVYK